MDPFFQVEVISRTENPQRVIYAAMHQDYAEDFVWNDRDSFPSEQKAGEIAVKRLLAGGRGHYGCYSADTEVLTAKGWKKWPDVTYSDRLLAVDPNNGTSQFEFPTALQCREINAGDQMYALDSQYLNFCVTGDHRMIVSYRKKGGGWSEWGARSARDAYGSPVRYLLNSCLMESDRSLPEDMPKGVDPIVAFKIAGFFFGDGLRTENANPICIRFRLRRPRKIAYMKSWGLDVAERAGDRYVVFCEELARWVHANFASKEGKTVPEWLLTLPDWAVAAFWDGLKNSDGTNVQDNSWCYDSTQKEALDLIQAVAHINGFSASMSLNNSNEGEGHEKHKPCWRLWISERSTRRIETCQKTRSIGVTESWVDYSGLVYCATVSTGALMVRRKGKVMVCGNCIEHPQIVFNIGWFPHSCMQQMRTHRSGISFDVQSFRYSGERICQVVEGTRSVEEVFYLRPVGSYTDRQGKKYDYTQKHRELDLEWCFAAAKLYATRIHQGFSEEHARSIIPFDVRQHWVMSVNARSLMHLLDLRAKLDAQLEAQQLCQLIWPHFVEWMPEIAGWYEANRLNKAKLSP